MGEDIKIAIAGVGNCASSLIQGVYYYKDVNSNDKIVPGLMNNVLGDYKISDIKPVAAFDIDERKVGKDLSEAIFSPPNCTKVFCNNIPKTGVEVKMAPVMDGVASHMKDHHKNKSFSVSKEKPVDVAEVLKESGVDVLINYMPVGSEKAVKFYAEECLKSGVAFINAMPVFIASNSKWEIKFKEKKLPIIGDDIKSQVGATIVHRTLTRLFAERGIKIERTYQLNTGGNTDFLNMLERARLTSKKISKTNSVQSQLPVPLEDDNIHIGPSDYVPWQKDNKVCFIRIEGKKFGDVPVELELRLSVEDSPNSAGVMIDAVRCAKIGLDREIGGALTSISSYTMKSPPKQYSDPLAREKVREFVEGKRDN